jgi:hypothetical protein
MKGKRQIVIPLYDHTSVQEIWDTLDAIKGIGIDDAFVEVRPEDKPE